MRAEIPAMARLAKGAVPSSPVCSHVVAIRSGAVAPALHSRHEGEVAIGDTNAGSWTGPSPQDP
jgi:hypothetical protein